jgi:hypothetical protein
MRSRVLSRFTYANVMATIAVFIALGGGAYAALKLPAKSVGAKQIKKNAVNSVKVRNGSLRLIDFRAGQLPAAGTGARGETGEKGDTGETGQRGPSGAPGSAGTPGERGPSDAYSAVQGPCTDGTSPIGFGCDRVATVVLALPAGDYEVMATGQVYNVLFASPPPPSDPPPGTATCVIDNLDSGAFAPQRTVVPGSGWTTPAGPGGIRGGMVMVTLAGTFHLPSGGTIAARCETQSGSGSSPMSYTQFRMHAVRVGALHP